jgi:hypothetical protein
MQRNITPAKSSNIQAEIRKKTMLIDTPKTHIHDRTIAMHGT